MFGSLKPVMCVSLPACCSYIQPYTHTHTHSHTYCHPQLRISPDPPSYQYIIIISLHRNTTYVDAAHCYTRSSTVCQSVCLSVRIVSLAKMAEPILMPFGMLTWVPGRPKEPCIKWRSSPYEGTIFRAKRSRPRTCLDMSGSRYTQCDSAEPA